MFKYRSKEATCVQFSELPIAMSVLPSKIMLSVVLVSFPFEISD